MHATEVVEVQPMKMSALGLADRNLRARNIRSLEVALRGRRLSAYPTKRQARSQFAVTGASPKLEAAPE